MCSSDLGSRYAFLRTGVEDGFITGDTADAVMNYMKAIEAAVEITDDINARYDAFANAEASLINNALVVPMGMSVPAYIATRLNYWEGQYASTGFSNKRLKGIHVLDHYFSMSVTMTNRVRIERPMRFARYLSISVRTPLFYLMNVG